MSPGGGFPYSDKRFLSGDGPIVSHGWVFPFFSRSIFTRGIIRLCPLVGVSSPSVGVFSQGCIVAFLPPGNDLFVSMVVIVVVVVVALQRASLRGRLPPATLAHKEIILTEQNNVNEAARELHDFRCKLTTCRCQELYAPVKRRRMHASYKSAREKNKSVVSFSDWK